MLSRTLIIAALSALLCPPAADARGAWVDVAVRDLVTQEVLPVHWHRGERWVAGTPGHRYSITLRNRSGGRVLAVLAVDGVNAVSGETAAWNQSGYVLRASETAEIRGWRKSQQRIAAFEFTALPQSYAARTGRPQNVGVIGVAVFREAPPPPPMSFLAPAEPAREESQAPSAKARQDAEAGARAESRIGTGHGRSEVSPVEFTRFERAQPTPDQVLTLRYDSRDNLIAMGVIAGALPWPQPFPGSVGFVPDPPAP